MMKLLKLAGFVFLSLVSMGSQAVERAGFIIVASGDVLASSSAEGERALKRRSPIFSGDVIKTGEASSVQIKFKDGAIIAVQESTELRIDEFAYEPESGEERSFLTLVKGQFRAVTGAVGKRSPEDYRINTPVATIGIRGTHYELAYGDDLAMAVWQGGIRACNSGGCLDLGMEADYRFGRVVDSSTMPEGSMRVPASLGQSFGRQASLRRAAQRVGQQGSDGVVGSVSGSNVRVKANEQRLSIIKAGAQEFVASLDLKDRQQLMASLSGGEQAGETPLSDKKLVRQLVAYVNRKLNDDGLLPSDIRQVASGSGTTLDTGGTGNPGGGDTRLTSTEIATLQASGQTAFFMNPAGHENLIVATGPSATAPVATLSGKSIFVAGNGSTDFVFADYFDTQNTELGNVIRNGTSTTPISLEPVGATRDYHLPDNTQLLEWASTSLFSDGDNPGLSTTITENVWLGVTDKTVPDVASILPQQTHISSLSRFSTLILGKGSVGDAQSYQLGFDINFSTGAISNGFFEIVEKTGTNEATWKFENITGQVTNNNIAFTSDFVGNRTVGGSFGLVATLNMEGVFVSASGSDGRGVFGSFSANSSADYIKGYWGGGLDQRFSSAGLFDEKDFKPIVAFGAVGELTGSGTTPIIADNSLLSFHAGRDLVSGDYDAFVTKGAYQEVLVSNNSSTSSNVGGQTISSSSTQVAWGRWLAVDERGDSTVSTVTGTSVDPMLWVTGTVADKAVLAAQTGGVIFDSLIDISTTDASLTSNTGSVNVDFSAGAFTSNFTLSDGSVDTWNLAFTGDVQGGAFTNVVSAGSVHNSTPVTANMAGGLVGDDFVVNAAVGVLNADDGVNAIQGTFVLGTAALD